MSAYMTHHHLQEGLSIIDSPSVDFREILTPAAFQFIAMLEREFGSRRRALLKKRDERQSAFTIGKLPVFAAETEQIRNTYWKTSPIPYPLNNRRVELVGPPEKQFLVDGLNSDANTLLADFEDTFSPTWTNVLQGHCNIHDAIHGSLMYTDALGHQHAVVQNGVTMIVRPRSWHLEENHLLIDGKPVSASLFDLGLFVFHNTQELRAQGMGPYCYLPKIESPQEAKLWNDIFMMMQDELKIPHGSIKATVSIETLTAAFGINEILFELRDHCVGLQCNWWNFLFNFTKKVRHLGEYTMPNLSRISPYTNFLHALSLLTIQTGHKHGVHVIAGPSIGNYAAREDDRMDDSLNKLLAEKSREAEEGFDGTWVLDTGMIEPARQAFNKIMTGPHQIHRKRDDVTITDEDLLKVHRSEFNTTELQNSIGPLIKYLSSWLNGKAVFSMNNRRMTATEAEIGRTQLWLWHHALRRHKTEDHSITGELYRSWSTEEFQKLISVEQNSGTISRYSTSKEILDRLVLDKSFIDFFPLSAYQHLE